jgi:hypothetical protein
MLVNIQTDGKPVFSENLEIALVPYCLIVEKRFVCLTSKDVNRMTYQPAIKNVVSHPFSGKDKKRDGNCLTILCADIRG